MARVAANSAPEAAANSALEAAAQAVSVFAGAPLPSQLPSSKNPRCIKDSSKSKRLRRLHHTQKPEGAPTAAAKAGHKQSIEPKRA